MKESNGDLVVVWANTVAEARYTLSVYEQRIILWLVAQIERKDDALREHKIGVLEIAEIMGTNGGRMYELFRKASKELVTRPLTLWDDRNGEWITFTWMNEIRYNPGTGCITLQFHKRLEDVLLNLRERFSTVPLKTVFKLQGGYAIRWYEMLQAKKYLGTFTMTVEELRGWLQISDGQLSAVKDLRKRALDVSKAELDHKADLTFTYAPTKVGRRIIGWKFKIKENHPRPVQRQLPLRGAEPEQSHEEIAKARASLAALKAELRK
jgi:plasmid replication initiation protein